MESRDIFVDTSGLFAAICPTDPAHEKSVEILKNAGKQKRCAVISDYILDETATLLIARKTPHLARALFLMVDQSSALRTLYIESERFERAKNLFLKHLDQQYSFTDCTSFILMNELNLQHALTADYHFHEMGFIALLKNSSLKSSK